MIFYRTNVFKRKMSSVKIHFVCEEKQLPKDRQDLQLNYVLIHFVQTNVNHVTL